MNYKVGICQFQPKLLEVKFNKNKMFQLVKDVDADLIVFPELATSGYVFTSKEEVKAVAEDYKSGETILFFKELSKKKNTSYILGFPEIFDGKLYNSSVLINPTGEINLYRKTHLFYEEKLFFEPGNTGFQVFEATKKVKIGLMICFDWIFPESARTLAMKGADIICQSANLVLPWCQEAMITRAIENRIFTVTANRIGKEINQDKELYFTGQSQIVSPQGKKLFRLSEQTEEVKIVEIDPKLSNNKQINDFNHIFKDRREEFYK